MPDEPGDRPPTGAPRRLERPPSARYGPPVDGPHDDEEGRDRAAQGRRSAVGPIVRAVFATAVGSLAIVLVGGILAVTSGLLFISGVTGAATGLLLAEAGVGDGTAAPALSRASVVRLAVVVVLVGFVAATLGLWLVARAEGGALGPVDLMLQVYGALVPAGAAIGALAAWWGVSVGPVRP
jgi:hypothetical protein